MRQQICYVYEYKESAPVRNVGFVRVEERKAGALFKICVKGILTQEKEQMEICGVRMRHRFCETVTLGTACVMRGTLMCDAETVERLDAMDGILIQSGGKVHFAAVWNKVSVNFTECVRREDLQEAERKDTVSENAEQAGMMQDIDGENTRADVDKRDGIQQMEEASVLEQEVPEMRQGDVKQEVEGGKESKEAVAGLRCRKISRTDLGELARREWKLANNSFLLHGYYNYHHLLLIEKGDRCVLGVPGIYHRRERQAAECFGFTEFREAGKLPVRLSAKERNDYERFGYWCRAVEKGTEKNV